LTSLGAALMVKDDDDLGGKGKGKRQRHITLVERLKSHTATSEALVMSQAKLA